MKANDVLQEVKAIFGNKWQTRQGRKVPEANEVQFGNDAVSINGTVLYADMMDSTGLVNGFKPWFAAEIYKAYLIAACRVIGKHGGELTAFDGDRVMAVFIGDYKNTSAVKASLQINYIVDQINSSIRSAYPNTAFTLKQAVGIDTSDLFVARTGIRTSNDLVWVGRAANYAAKLCSLGDENFPTYITQDVFTKLNEEAKYGGKPRQSMWEKRTWTVRGLVVYRSSWRWMF